MKDKKHVIITLEYDMGDYSDIEEDGCLISIKPEDYEESFYQSDAALHDMKIVGVKIRS